MKLLKERIGSLGEPMAPAAELLHVSEDMDEPVIANNRAAFEDSCSEPF